MITLWFQHEATGKFAFVRRVRANSRICSPFFIAAYCRAFGLSAEIIETNYV